MRIVIALLFFLTTLTVSAQTDFYEHWKFYPGQTSPITWTDKGYVRMVVEPADTSTYVYTLSRTKKVWQLPPIVIPATSFVSQTGIVVVDGILGGVDKADWLKYSVAIADKYKKIVYRYAMSDTQGGGVEFRTGSITGPVFASAQLPVTGGWAAYVELEITITTPVNASEIFVTFQNSPRTTGSGGNIQWFEFR